MAPPESVPSATVTDLATARRRRGRGTAAGETERTAADAAGTAAPRRVPNRRFDTEKVERLKRAIEEGRYEIDPESVADRFIEHERNN